MKYKYYLFFQLLTVAVILTSSCRATTADPSKVWRTYENQQHGYIFNYPPDCTYGPLPSDCKNESPEAQRPACICFLNTENPDRVLMQRFQSDGAQLVMAEFSIAHLNTSVDNPPTESGLTDWLVEKFPDKWENAKFENITLDDVAAVSISSSGSEMAPAVKEIYFIHTDQLFQISMLNPHLEINSKLYKSILASFRFEGIEE